MGKCSQFANLLNQAFDRIKATGQTKESIKLKLAHGINKGVHLIEHWQRGNCPAEHMQTEIAAKLLLTERGLLNREEVELFLSYAGHPSPATVWTRWFTKVEGPPSDVVDIFIGREEKIDELSRALQLGRVVVLWGAGGIGKTSLVGAVIQRIAPNNITPSQFPHGILYYNFYGPEHTADDALRHIARFFGVEVTKDITPRDAASYALEDKRALIILDGAEEVDELRKVWRIRHLCGMLIVSRYEYLDLSDKVIYLDILSPDEAVLALQAWSSDEESHSAIKVWNIDVNCENQIAREICEELGRLPLALRLAGRYMLRREINPIRFLELFREWQLILFHEGKGQHDNLQILMEKSLDQVCQLGNEDARKVMAVAGLLSYEPFTTEVIAATLEKSSTVIRKLIQDLWKFSLIRQISSERWQVVHRLIYTYTHALPAPDGATERLAEYYTRLTQEQNKLGLDGFRKLDLEHPHLLTILARSFKQKDWLKVVALTSALDHYLQFQGYWAEREVTLSSGLEAARSLRNWQFEAKLLFKLGKLYCDKCEWDEAIKLCLRTLEVIRRQEVPKYFLAPVYVTIGTAYVGLEEMDKARLWYHHAWVISGMERDLVDGLTILTNLDSNNVHIALNVPQSEEVIRSYQRARHAFEVQKNGMCQER